jgi:L-2,4-diaminobutyric acid acetyltransferase
MEAFRVLKDCERQESLTPGRASATKCQPRVGLIFRKPMARDARDVNDLVAACPPLDTNSLYCNLLQCTHFADTCLLAEQDGDIKGWISSYRPPDDPTAIFVWQIAVHESHRGRGLGVDLLQRLLCLPGASRASHLKATVTPSNRASRAFFTRFARQQGLELDTRPWFDTVVHFGGRHESETLFSIGPLHPASLPPTTNPTERINQ